MAQFKTQVGELTEINHLTWSAGVLESSDYVTQASATTVDVAAGTGLFRTGASALSSIIRLSWAQSLGLSAPLNSIRYVGVNYNAGTPVAFVTATFSDFDWYTKFPLAKIYNNGIKMHVVNANAHSEDTSNLTRQMLRQCFPFRSTQSPEGGGLALGSPTGRYITVSAGSAWHGFNKYTIPAFDSQTAQRFDTVWRDGVGGFNSTANVQVWPNTQIDDGTGTLLTMTNNRYGCLWLYIDVEDGDVKMIYGRDQYVTFLQAEQEAPPSTFPLGLNEHSVLLGRIIFQKSAASGVVQSALDNLFQTQGISVHNELSSLQGGTAGEYYHLTSSDYTALTGTIPVTRGGTGLSAIGTSRLLWSTAANTLGEIALGYGMQVASGELRTPQDLRTSASPTFSGLGVSGNSATPVVITFNNNNPGTSAGTKLDFQFNGGSTNYILSQFDGGDFNLFFSSNKKVYMATAGSNRMTVDQAGNVGIGIESSGPRLEIDGDFKTGSPSGGTAQPWKLGNYTAGVAAQVGKVRVEINGTPYDLLTA